MVLDNIYVYPHDLELGIYEQVIQNPDDSFTILLNSRYNHETQVEAYLHTLEHIRCRDFEKTDVQQIEAEAHADTIVIDSDLDERGRLEAYMHELRHIERDDFEIGKNADVAERVAHLR